MGGWEEFYATRFPGYLLPSGVNDLTHAEATRFLEGLHGRPDALHLLRTASLFTGAALRERIERFVHHELPALVAELPSRMNVVRRQWEGGFQGRLHLAQTMALHAEGRRTAFVTQSRLRVFDLPEVVLVRSVAERLLRAVRYVRQEEGDQDRSWTSGLSELEGRLTTLSMSTVLREVPEMPLTDLHRSAARSAHGPAFATAVLLDQDLHRGLESDDQEPLVAFLATNAWQPKKNHTRFELAVAMRIGELLHAGLQEEDGGPWEKQHAIIRAGRREIVRFVRAGRGDVTAVNVFYNQAFLPCIGQATREEVQAYYLDGTASRPDVIVTVTRPHGPPLALLFECKLSEELAYLKAGYREAVTYAREFRDHLTTWPKAVLVAPLRRLVKGTIREMDEVVVVGWEDLDRCLHSLVNAARERPSVAEETYG